jgi:predicted acyltransferase (DUF342 family)
MSTIVKAIMATHDRDDFFEVEDEAVYKGPVYPKSALQTERPIKVGRAAQVDGQIFGKDVRLLDGTSPEIQNSTRSLSIFSRNNVAIGDFCNIHGHITCAGEVSIGNHVMILGSVIARNIRQIGSHTRIQGNVICMESLTIDEHVEIGGYVIVLNGSVAIGNHSKVFDIIANGDIELGEGVSLVDPTIWSENGSIEFDKVTVGEAYSIKKDMIDVVSSDSINTYRTAVNTFDYDVITEKLREALKNSPT